MKTYKLKQPFYLLFSIFIIALLSACASVQKQSAPLSAQTKLSSIITLKQIPIEKRTIYLQWQNTAGLNVRLKSQIIKALEKAGYRFVSNQQKAHYQLQLTLLQIGLGNQDQLQTILASDYGDPLLTLPAVINSQNSSPKLPYSNVVNVSNLSPIMTLDLQISEMVQSNGAETAAWNRYQTRIVSYAQQLNVTFKQIQKLMNSDIVNTIVNIFPGVGARHAWPVP